MNRAQQDLMLLWPEINQPFSFLILAYAVAIKGKNGLTLCLYVDLLKR